MNDRFPQLFWGLVALSVAILIGSVAGALAVRDIKRANDEVTVTGSARRPVRADFIVWRAGVSTQQPTLAAAYQQLKGNSDRVRQYLRSHGVADSLITVRAVEVGNIPEISQGRETGRILGYRLTQFFEVRSADVDGVSRLAQEINELISEGVPLLPQPPEYLFTHLADVRVQMLADATRDARDRAIAIAQSTGTKIGPVRSARMGVFQITPRNSTEVSDYGINDVSALEKDITSVVRVTFSVR
jgi:uncharacterized protein